MTHALTASGDDYAWVENPPYEIRLRDLYIIATAMRPMIAPAARLVSFPTSVGVKKIETRTTHAKNNRNSPNALLICAS